VPPPSTSVLNETTIATMDNATSTSSSSINDNFKMLLKVHFFDQVMKLECCSSLLWDMIDCNKLRDGLESLVKAVQAYKTEEQQNRLRLIGESKEEVQLIGGANKDSFPVLKQFHIPLKGSIISSLQCNIVRLSSSSLIKNLLCFKYHNNSICTLVQVPKSTTYSHFKRNAKRVKWIDDVLLAAARSGCQDEAAEWILRYLGEFHHDAFITAESSVGILLCSKVMDAYSACAMWEEANMPLWAQHVILHHLSNFFGWRLTVPERQIRELEAGALHPISDSVVVDKETITFWYREIDQAILDCLQMELKFKEKEYLQQLGFNSIDIVFGGDHGAKRFHAVIKLIIRNKEDTSVSPISVVITVGNIDCTKETREILNKTIATPINDGLRRIVNKFFVLYCQADQYIATIADEPARVDPSIGDTFCFSSRVFIAGDLAFFSLILGNENRSSKWCNWCILSPKEWSVVGHDRRELWTIDNIYGIHQQVRYGIITEAPHHIKGCTETPIIDAVPVDNYVLSVAYYYWHW